MIIDVNKFLSDGKELVNLNFIEGGILFNRLFPSDCIAHDRNYQNQCNCK